MSSPLPIKEKHDAAEAENSHPETLPPINHDDEQLVPEPKSFNPTLENECEEEDLERLKGDAIGDTLYSERFVLTTLLKLGQLHKDLKEEEDVEHDLCSLWDMTIEKDVVKYLLEQDVLELFAGIIKTTQDKRLSEILVGILANMCNVTETRTQLEQQDETVQVLLELTSCLDTLTLEQLMRLLAVVFVKMDEKSVLKWYDHILKSEQFTENLCFILTSAASNTLILQTMETLNAILAKFTLIDIPLELESKMPTFEEVFVSTPLIYATIETFEALHKEYFSSMDTYDGVPECVLKANQTFCNIHSILAQYGETSKTAYKPCNDKMLWCFNEILKSIADDEPASLWQQYEHDVLESLNDMLRVLADPFNLKIAQSLLQIFFRVSESQEHAEDLKKSCSKTRDFENEADDDVDQLDYQVLLAIILNTIYFLILKASREMLCQCVTINTRKYTMKLMDSFQHPLETESLKACYLKLKDVLDAK